MTNCPSLIGDSEAISQVKHLVSKVAPTTTNVLITGPSGSGKEVVALNVHAMSNRSDAPFIAVNCGAIPPELLESELFGHEKGAFTGAISARKGRFEAANGGTLFLDEIGDMPLNMQVKLLRVIQERKIDRVGGVKSIPINVRLIAATHQPLETLIESGKFREDLYYRLNVFPIPLPGLSERSDDIEQIINAWIADEADLTIKGLADDAMQALKHYPWPGNIRELKNLIERLSVLHQDEVVTLKDLPSKFQNHLIEATVQHAEQFDTPILQKAIHLPAAGIDLKQTITDIECQLIEDALKMSNGVVSHAATLLSIRRTTLVEKIKKYQINETDSVAN